MKRILLGIFLLHPIFGFSQQATGQRLELGIKEAIEIGLRNRYDIKSKSYEVELKTGETSKAKKEWIPEISATGNIRYSPDIQATFIPGGFFTPDPSLVALGAKSLGIFGLELNQTVFKPGIGIETKIAKNNEAIAHEKLRQDENAVKEQIVIAYLNVNLKHLQYEIAAKEEQRFKEYAILSEGKYQLGSMIETDYLKSKLDFENAKVETQKALQNYDLALLNIKFQINMPQNTALVITDTLNSDNLNRINGPVLAETNDRTEIRQLLLQKAGLDLELNKTRQAALPSVSLYANYSKQFSYNNLDFTLGQWWSTYNYVGLQFKIPITSNFRNYNNIQEHKIKLQQNDLNLKQKIADIDYEVQKASTEVSNAQKNMQVTKNNFELSETIYANQKQQYELGSRQYSDLLDTERSLSQAEQNYIKAVYEYLDATVGYQKAIGVL